MVAGLLWVFQQAAAEREQHPVLKKIQVLDSNNSPVQMRYHALVLPQSLDEPDYRMLRERTRSAVKLGDNEWENFMLLLAWVSTRWQHDPYAQAGTSSSALDILLQAEHGQRFSCVEYSKVLRDALIANGYAARTVSIQRKDTAYAGMGSAHVVVEAWSNTWDQWIYLDPQWGLFARYQDKPLNVYEIYQLKQQGLFDNIEWVGVVDGRPIDQNEYRQFLVEYFGYISVSARQDNSPVNLLLGLEGRQWPLTFQGLPRKSPLFSLDPADVYFSLDHTSVLLRYRMDSQPMKKQGVMEFDSEEEYLSRMPLFAALPDFDVITKNNMPWFSYLEISRDGGQWQRKETEPFRWLLHDGKNRLQVRAVNAAGRAGVATHIVIQYGD